MVTLENWKKAALILLFLPTSCAISLLNGRFETTTDVQDILDLALDAADMKEAASIDEKLQIYQQGVSRRSDPTITLQSLSLNAGEVMSQSPMYNIFRYAFLELGKVASDATDGTFDDQPVDRYGDTLVNDLFSLNVPEIETEAALVTTVWMSAVHEIFEALKECKSNNKNKGLAALDKAAAFWIGANQQEGDNDGGHMLYNLAENAGERFGQDNGETIINTQIIHHMQAIQTIFSSNQCISIDGYVEMRPIVKQLVGAMTVPLVQNFIHHSINVQNEEGGAFIELYALATIPRVVACDPEAYYEALHLEVLRALQPAEAQAAIQALQNVYSCLDITCDQVGSYLGGVVPECRDSRPFVKAAGYETERSGALRKARIDRDIKAIDIFLRFEAYEAVEDWYTYGWHSIYTLKQMATDQIVPQFSAGHSYIQTFQTYYGSKSFADRLITDILDFVPPYNSASKEQIRHSILGVLKYVIVFMTSASSLQYAIDQCGINRNSSLAFWDTGSLLYIGSLEGENEGGSVFGDESLFSTGRDLCGDFETCVGGIRGSNTAVLAAANEYIVKGFKQVVELLTKESCGSARVILYDQILANMAIPMIQGTVKFASYNSGLPQGSSLASLAIGDTFARSILPFIDKVDNSSSATIFDNLQFQLFSKPVPDGFAAVVDALRATIGEMATSCTDVGIFEDEPSESNLCSGTTRGDNYDQGDSALGFGRYNFRHSFVAEADSSLALDIRDMFEATSLDAASDIYRNGANAMTMGFTDEVGILSLSSLSLNASQFMKEDPIFNVFLYSMYDEEELQDFRTDGFAYADAIVNEALFDGQESKLAAEAAVVLNIWMMIVHRLYDTVRLCEKQADASQMVDSAVALWIGKEQREGKFEQGWMLYSIAQSAARFFGLDEGEAQVNTDLMDLFIETQVAASKCSTEDRASEKLYFLTQELIRTLAKPLILTMLYLTSGSRNMLELYTVAVIPFAMACDENTGKRLQDVLLDESYSQDALNNDLIDSLAAILRCQRMTAADLRHGDSISVEFRKFLASLSDKIEASESLTTLAGYDPKTDVSEIARLDLDVLETRIMMKTRAYRAAQWIYNHGHNAYDSNKEWGYLSMKDMARRQQIGEEDLPRNMYETHYGSQYVADSIMKMAFSGSDEFSSATAGQLVAIATKTLQCMVTLDGIQERIQVSRELCAKAASNHDPQNVSLPSNVVLENKWDEAVALFVGSMVGNSIITGGEYHDDFFLYALNRKVCSDFGTCKASGESSTNEDILVQFAAGRDAISYGSCDELEHIEKKLVPLLLSTLIQGTISVLNDNQSLDTSENPDSLGAAFILSKAIEPMVAQSNATSADILESVLGNFAVLRTDRPVGQVVDAFAYALPGLAIDCQKLSKNPNLPMCINNTAPQPKTPTNLGEGLFVSTHFVQDHANIARDVVDMQSALETNSHRLASTIYTDGKNSERLDENGNIDSLRSLSSFSTEETFEMEDEPLFNFFKYALEDDQGLFKGRDVRLYADSIVLDSFSGPPGGSGSSTLPIEAALSLNLWMQVAHVLYKTLKDCRNKQVFRQDGIHFVDIAAAYWIGDGQVASGDDGHLLYALSERLGKQFDLDQGGQSRTNSNMLKFLSEAKNEISLPGSCTGTDSYLRLGRIVNKIVSVMTVPLIQSLILALRENDSARVKLYSQSVVPMVAQCNGVQYGYLKGKLLNVSFTTIEIDEIIAALQSMYPCLGLSCNDIGNYASDGTANLTTCRDPDGFESLAGYQPKYGVRDFALLDLDVRQLDILLQMGAFDAAENLYTYGRNGIRASKGSTSLFDLATTGKRSIVPDFDAFDRYYSNFYSDPYSDRIIRSALQGTGSENWTVEQRRIIVLKSIQVLVMCFGSLLHLYEAVSTCDSSSKRRLSLGKVIGEKWDQGAALIIGSLEGTEIDGTHQGYFYFDLVREHCKKFGTCLPDGSSVQVNERLISLLYTGRGALTSGSCWNARKALEEIKSLLMVPVIQGVLSSAVHLSQTNGVDAEKYRAKAFVYSRALLPLVAGVDSGASRTIEQHLGYPGMRSTRNIVSEVFSAFADIYSDMGIECHLIGTIDGHDPCDGVGHKKKLDLMWIVLASVLVTCSLCTCTALFRLGRVNKRRLPENIPRFILSETGELNHSMDLLEKAFSKRSGPRMASKLDETMVPLNEDMYPDVFSSAIDDSDYTTTSSRSGADVI